LGEIPPVIKKLHLFESADKISKPPGKCTQPDDKTHAGVSATSYHKNIKVLALGEPLSAILDTIKSESCIYESVSTDMVDSNKDLLIPT
jgi:hypothetical protein